MKVLVLSDSHSALRFMRKCIEKIKPDAIVHLGDYHDDGQTLAEALGGVMSYMTHGHRELVKSGIGHLVAEARRYGAQVALYGHTHAPDCHRETDGLWVLNPGSAGGSAGLLETDGQAVTACYLLTETDLEDMV